MIRGQNLTNKLKEKEDLYQGIKSKHDSGVKYEDEIKEFSDNIV